MLVAEPGEEPVLLDFFVAAPGDGARAEDARAARPRRGRLRRRRAQVFHVGAASCGAYGNPAGIDAAMRRWGSRAAGRPRRARRGAGARRASSSTPSRPRSSTCSRRSCARRPSARRSTRPAGALLAAGDVVARRRARRRDRALRQPRARAPFYEGDIGAAVVAWIERARRRAHRGGPRGLRGDRARAAARALPRPRRAHEPAAVGRRDPARARARAARRGAGAAALQAIVGAMEDAQAERTPEFVEGLTEPGFVGRGSWPRGWARRRTSPSSTATGAACAVTCTNGEGSGVVVPGTGIHLNNIMGEEDLSPLGFHHAPPGRRMPSMMSPTVVARRRRRASSSRSAARAPTGSARRCCRRSSGVVDHGLAAGRRGRRAAGALRGRRRLRRAGHPARRAALRRRTRSARSARNLFFGGVQAVWRDPATAARSAAPATRAAAAWRSSA